jgi:hypothetical protein
MPAAPQEPSELQRALIERARARHLSPPKVLKRQWLPRLLSLAIAAAAALMLFLLFDRFLGALQRYLEITGDGPGEAAEAVSAPAPGDPMPVFVIEAPPDEAEAQPPPGEAR